MTICVDAGGSKCLAILFDERLRRLGVGRSGGVNTNSTSPEDSLRNMDECVERLFADFSPSHVDRVYHTFVGPWDAMAERISRRVTVGEYRPLGEGQAGLFAGSVRTTGLVALSGTGSDVFYVKDGVGAGSVGGWGPILGDHGSGWWIGQRAVSAVVRELDGWGEPTALTGLIWEALGLSHGRDLVPITYRAASPFRQTASLAPIVCRAAAAGDAVATAILTEAGELLAAQMEALVRRAIVPASERDVTLCGSVWKGNPTMRAAFAASLRARGIEAEVRPSRFEPIMAGVALGLIEAGVHADEARVRMEASFPEYIIES